MHVLLIDKSHGKAKRRAVAVLDSYAIRTGDASWSTPITLEALQELKAALRRSASKSTCVGCYISVGRARMRLAWIVGRSHEFEPHGATPVATTRVKRVRYTAPWVREVALLATAAGLAHDVGKASRMFQAKLRAALQGKLLRDKVRHEWLSLQVRRRMRSGLSWQAAWRLGDSRGAIVNELPPFFRTAMSGPMEAVDFLIASHHGLFGPLGGAALSLPDASLHIRDGACPGEKELQAEHRLVQPLLDRMGKTEARLQRFQRDDEGCGSVGARWWARALVGRAALIFADHVVSACPQIDAKAFLYANTGPGKGGARVLKQSLDHHLDQVGVLAGQVAVEMSRMRLEGLAPASIESIMRPADTDSRFAWQNEAVDFLLRHRAQDERPVLVLNLAGTGTGKTRMNAKAACALRGGLVRFSVALNLRSLTLQTGDAFLQQLEIGADEIAVVIGDPVVRALHEAARSQSRPDNTDDNPDVDFYDAIGSDFSLPSWLDPWIKMHPEQRQLLGAPVLVSTIDYLIAAGEPYLQQHHVSALLRLLSGSDLVLDEIDGYEPQALVAVLRLVQMAAMCGRNVIASSATLSYPVARAVASAFDSGARAGSAMRAEKTDGTFSAVLISDAQSPATVPVGEQFDMAYREYVERSLTRLDRPSAPVFRRAKIWEILKKKDMASPHAAWMRRVAEGVLFLHQRNSWPFGSTGKRLSFGLVRVANINHGVALARSLATSEILAGMTLRVACYHSQDLLIQRHLKERRLDFLLGRALGDAHIVADQDISSIVDASKHENVCFIVVATPVEEIGRDHDFDWGVIEPSSSQSIVQVAGRINRHRLIPIGLGAYNVLVLRFNHRALSIIKSLPGGQLGKRSSPVFCRPGLERAGRLYSQIDAIELLNKEFPVDARIRFRHQYEFSRLDDASIQEQVADPLKILASVANEPSPVLLARQFYESFKLRDATVKKQSLRVFMEDGVPVLRREEVDAQSFKHCWVRRDDEYRREPEVENAWLAWSPHELVTQCEQYGIDAERGMQVETIYTEDMRDLVWDSSFGFHT